MKVNALTRFVRYLGFEFSRSRDHKMEDKEARKPMSRTFGKISMGPGIFVSGAP